MLMEVTCRCGWATRGAKPEIIAMVREHGRSAHQQEITPAEVRAIWRMVDQRPERVRELERAREGSASAEDGAKK